MTQDQRRKPPESTPPSPLGAWRHPTLADTGITAPVRCRCGRQTSPEMMYDVRTLGVGAAHVCSACVEDLYRKGITDRLTFHRRAGAPRSWLDAYAAKLTRGPLLRAGLPPEVWGEILARALDRAAAAKAARAAPPEGSGV